VNNCPVGHPYPSPLPNPGSDAARKHGCICAVFDNNRGLRAPWGDDGWWITVGCPLHAPVTDKEET
jgi:hypothetical protein